MKAIVELKDEQGYTQMVLTSSGKVSRVIEHAAECDLEANRESFQYLKNLATFQKGWSLSVTPASEGGLQ